jgi:prophage antirepressor-like protein
MDLEVFHHETWSVRTLLIDDEPWFVGRDVCDALGYGNARQAISTHVNEADRGVQTLDTPGGAQPTAIVNESGLYALIFGSRLDTAKAFRRWVTSEVLPSIRRTGRYATLAATPDVPAAQADRDIANEHNATVDALAGVQADKEQLVSALIEAKRQRDVLASKLISHGVKASDLYTGGDNKPFGGWHFEDGYKIVPNAQPLENIEELPTPTPEQVEALAEELCDIAPVTAPWRVTEYKDEWRAIARAAFAHIQQPARPKGLPSAEELDRVWVEKYDLPSFLAYATHAIDYLAPYLRDPVGWDPITLEEYTDMRNRLTRGNDWKQQLAKEYDWLRSRIRPVMECTECDRWKGYGVKMEDNARVLAKRIDKTRISMDAARTALEGE